YTGSTRLERGFGTRVASSGFVVVNVDYALSPEHPFPRALEDCVYATRWIARYIGDYGGDPNQLFLGGGSAGGNLAAEVGLALHGDHGGVDGGDLAEMEVTL